MNIFSRIKQWALLVFWYSEDKKAKKCRYRYKIYKTKDDSTDKTPFICDPVANAWIMSAYANLT
jgi:C4-type Zn-finger protein